MCGCRKALERTAKRLVEESLKEALSGCVEEHRRRRVLLTDVRSVISFSAAAAESLADRSIACIIPDHMDAVVHLVSMSVERNLMQIP